LLSQPYKGPKPIIPGASLLCGLAEPFAVEILESVEAIARHAPFRHMTTPGGYGMSVSMTNCGGFGWVTNRTGYRYDANDPESGQPWPTMPPLLRTLARWAASEAGYFDFAPDSCLINRYAPGTKLSLHQDKNELSHDAPIVSVSLGLPATFLFGGVSRKEPTRKIGLLHGDVVVWGGPARMAFHGVAPIKDGSHPLTGQARINLTFRKSR
jgi:alkylated DNA repair protein (DNA oxidative demethylase)